MNYLSYYSLAGVLLLVLLLWVWLSRLRPLPPRNVKTNPTTPLSKRGATVGINFSDWLVRQACEQTGADLSKDPLAMMRLREASQKAVEELSRNGKTRVDLPFLHANASGPKSFKLEVTRDMVAGIKLQ